MSRELVRSPRHSRDRGLGQLALAWIEFFCVHGPGDVQDRPLDPDLPDALPLDDEFAGFILDAYALSDKGRRLYTSVFLSRAKGRAKSEIAGFIALFEAFGPARFAGWAEGGEVLEIGEFRYEYEPGEAMGRPVTYPFIRCLATEEGQAGNTYDNIYRNLGGYGEGTGSQRLIDTYSVNRNDVMLSGIKLPYDGGEIVPSTSASASKDGGKETFVVFDETHLYTTPDLHRMWTTVSQNLDKRKDAEPWSLETSTMYAPGEGSIAEQTHAEARRVMEGKAKNSSVLFDHRQADPNTDLGDIESIKVGLCEAYGPASAWMDIERMAANFFDKRRSVANQRRYYLNQATAASDAWLTAVDVEAVQKVVEVAPKTEITLGFDGSEKRTGRGRVADATALIGCRVSDGHIFEIEVWEQPDGPEGEDWSVDVQAVKDAVDNAFAVYEVVGFYADPPKWEGVVAEWENAYTERLRVKASPRGAVTWWTNRTTLMGRALDAFENAVKDRDITVEGPGVITRHLLNARRRPRRDAMAIGKEHPKSRNKIDAAMAAVLAFQARADFLANGQAKRKRAFKAVTVRRTV